MNRFLEGWSGYFRYGNSSNALVKTMAFAAERIARFVAKLHRKRFSFGWLTYCRSPDRLGLVSLKRMVVTPRPTQLERTPGS